MSPKKLVVLDVDPPHDPLAVDEELPGELGLVALEVGVVGRRDLVRASSLPLAATSLIAASASPAGAATAFGVVTPAPAPAETGA